MAVIYTVDHLFWIASPDCTPQIIFQPGFFTIVFLHMQNGPQCTN